MKTYKVSYRMYEFDKEKSIQVKAKNKCEAHYKAAFENIPEIEGSQPYSCWVDGYITKAGKINYFNTCEGFPY